MESTVVLALGKVPIEYHVATALFSLVITPTLIANILLLFIVFRSTHFRDLSTMLVAFISIADLMYVIYMCVYIAMQYTLHDVSDAVCTVVITTQSILRMVPAVTFVLVACNWYLAKFKPAVCYKFHQVKYVSLKCFLVTWAVAIAACIGVPFSVCGRFNEAGFLVYLVLSFVGQSTAIIIEVILHIKNLLKTLSELEPLNSTKVKRTKNNILYFNIKITKVFLFLSVVYFLFSVPLLLYPFFGFALGVDSSPFAIFLYHIISSIPCLMNPISLYFISQKFQDELRSLFGIEKPKSHNEKPAQIMPEAFSANRGFFEPRTPAWRQGTEYWNREPIYGEYPSTTPDVKDASKKKGKKKDVRFCDIVEEVEPMPSTPNSVSLTSPTVVKAPTAIDAPKSPRLTSPPICTHERRQQVQTNDTSPQRPPNTGGCSRLVSALDLGTRRGSWPSSRSSPPYSQFQDVDLSRLGPASLLQQNKQFKRNLIKRSKSAYQPRRNEENARTSTETDDARRRISTTTTRTVQVHIDLCEKEVLETYL